MTASASSPVSAPLPPPRRPRRIASVVRVAVVCLIIGLLVNVAVCVMLATWLDPLAGELSSMVAVSGSDDRWSVSRYDRAASTLVISEHAAAVNWSHRQACGPPDTPTAGDQVTAWASAGSDSAVEWLELDFAAAVVPSMVKVVETYNPGALFKVDVYRDDGTTVTAWEGVDPTPVGSGMGTSDIPLKIDFPIRTVRLWIDSPKVPGWNEIDAVGLVDRGGNVQWAVKSRASSFYGQGSFLPPAAKTAAAAGPSPADLLPDFGDLKPISAAIENGTANLERRVIVGYGWPMRALWTPLDASVGAPTPVPAMSAFTVAVTANPATPTKLPYRPAWGLAVNTALFALIVGVLYWLAVMPRRFLAEVARIRRGACLVCGYDLGYDFIKGCPECGWRRDQGSNEPGR